MQSTSPPTGSVVVGQVMALMVPVPPWVKVSVTAMLPISTLPVLVTAKV